MAIVHAVAGLYDAVVARFAVEGPWLEDGLTAKPNLFGWRTPQEQLVNTDRICWVPGDPHGSFGAFLAPMSISGTRSLGTVEELFFVDIIAADRSDPENERKQYEAVRTLYDYWYRALYHAAYAIGAGGQIGIVREEWLTEKLERRHGAALRVICSVLSPVLDEAPDGGSGGTTAPADTGALINVHELDVTETVVAEPGAEEP